MAAIFLRLGPPVLRVFCIPGGSGCVEGEPARGADMARLKNAYDSPPAWYCKSTGGICLRGAIFRDANLESALLWRGDFTGAIFEGAHLTRADLGITILSR